MLLRFRSDIVAAQGDIRNMFYMIRVSKQEEMMQLWIWKFKGEEKIRTFAMTRLVMGNRPSSNISVLAVRECTNLSNYREKYREACSALLRNSYVDNVFVNASNVEVLLERISEIEEIALAGNLYLILGCCLMGFQMTNQLYLLDVLILKKLWECTGILVWINYLSSWKFHRMKAC